MTTRLREIAGADSLRAFFEQRPVAHGLPAFAYTSQEYWQLENETLFRNNWIFAGFAHQLPNAGDVAPLTIGGHPVFLVRNKEHQIKAFHNACRHRCLKLIDELGNAGPRLRCPYHSWVYDLNGNLRSTPYLGGPGHHDAPGFDRADHGLLPVGCAVWHDWVFVNLGAAPEPFEQVVSPLRSRLSGVDLDVVTPVATLEFGEVHCNWKLLMENFIEPYHVQFVHSTTTDQPLTDHKTIIDGRCLGSAVDLSRPVEGKQNTLAVDSRYLTLFPNFVIGTYCPDQIGVHLNLPLDVDRTLQIRVIYVTDGNTRSDAEIGRLEALWHKVHKEDHAMCERLQLGRASPVAEIGGVLSPHWENSVRRFQELVLAAVS